MRLRAGGSNILDKEVSKRAKERAGLPWADMLLPLRGARSDPWQADAAAVPQLEPARDRLRPNLFLFLGGAHKAACCAANLYAPAEKQKEKEDRAS